MTKKIKFVKMHGLGNDFVIVDSKDLPTTQVNLSKLAKDIADRHLGIGCDQFIIYNKKSEYYEMLVYNSDGSSAKLCGNASRCVARLIYLNSGEQNITIKIGSKKLLCSVNDSGISVDMGIVSFQELWMPSREKIWSLAERYMIDLKEIICVDVGNPHLVIFSKLSNQDQNIIGEKLQDKELFTDGVNVNFAEVKDNKICLSVWERGAGLTLACGSGACASFAASLKLGFTHSPSEVVFKFGSLIMSEQDSRIIMTGPASLVASGEFDYD